MAWLDFFHAFYFLVISFNSSFWALLERASELRDRPEYMVIGFPFLPSDFLKDSRKVLSILQMDTRLSDIQINSGSQIQRALASCAERAGYSFPNSADR